MTENEMEAEDLVIEPLLGVVPAPGRLEELIEQWQGTLDLLEESERREGE